MSTGSQRRPRPWREKFGDAFRGVYLGVRGQSSFRVHGPAALLVIAAAIGFRCDRLEWGLLLGCIGAVFTTELFNSALEELFRGLDEPTKNRITGCLDMAAGAVLLAAATSVVIGAIVFIPKLWALFE
jgi:diacylglycerol kinase